MDFSPCVLFFSLKDSLFNIWIGHTCTHVQARVFIYHIAHWFCFSFFNSRFRSFCGSDVYQSNQMSLLSLSRKHTLTPSLANHKDLTVKIMNTFRKCDPRNPQTANKTNVLMMPIAMAEYNLQHSDPRLGCCPDILNHVLNKNAAFFFCVCRVCPDFGSEGITSSMSLCRCG